MYFAVYVDDNEREREFMDKTLMRTSFTVFIQLLQRFSGVKLMLIFCVVYNKLHWTRQYILVIIRTGFATAGSY